MALLMVLQGQILLLQLLKEVIKHMVDATFQPATIHC